ncbi:MAG: CoB--CoM heterodisulfide reductase iron-sulfur subunit A family protein [bacterium]
MNRKKVYKKVMVVGGGIAGVQAALDLADSGIEVVLIEKSPSIGGRMAQLDKTFPTNDCSLCILSPKLVEAGSHPYIHIITNAEVESVNGEAPHFTVTIRKKPRYVDEVKCTGCGVCMTKCPVKIPDIYNVGLMDSKCIHIPFPQAVPAVAIIDADHCIYLTRGKCRICEKFCEPQAIDFEQKEEILDVQVGSIILASGLAEFNAVRKDDYAYKICPNVVTSMEFERILSASGPTHGHIVRPSDNKEPKKIAFIQCVGSRDSQVGIEYCSAICCMQAAKDAIIINEHLSDAEITVFGMDIRACGKNFDRFIERAESEYNTRFVRARISSVDIDPTTDNLLVHYEEDGRTRRESFEFLILSVGLRPTSQLRQLAEKLGIEVDGFGFIQTAPFTPVSTSRPGIFACGTSCGPKDIPESVIEASAAASSAGIMVKDFPKKMIAVKYPSEREITDGDRPRVGVFICHCGINIAATVDVKHVVAAVSKLPFVVYSQDLIFACSQDAQKLIMDKIHEQLLNRIVVAACTPRTHEPLFQDTLRKAGLNAYLFDFANIRDQCSWVHQKEPGKATEKAIDLIKMSVKKVIHQEPLKKTKSSVNKNSLVIGGGVAGMTAALDLAGQGYHVDLIEKELELGGNLRRISYILEGEVTKPILESLVEEVNAHTQICVHMDSKIEKIEGFIGNYKTTIESNHTNLQDQYFESGTKERKEEQRQIEHGIVIVATGAHEFKPTDYCYGQDKRVMTQREIEREISTNGNVLRNLKAVVMISCVGSRDDDHPYCSRVCCSTAIKNALLLKEINPQIQIFVLYRDVRTYGLKEIFYKKAREAGIIFIHYDKNHKPEVVIDDGRLVVEIDEKIMEKRLRLTPDLLVLNSGIVPNDDNKFLSQALKVPLGTDGFFFEAHVKLRPVDFATDGIFLCGLAHYPKDLSESIVQAKAAASRAVTVLSRDEIESESKVAFVDEERCNGCELCVHVCAYSAIELDSERGVAVVNEALCKGCGTCTASCRPSAIDLKGFRDTQILAALCAL